MYRQHSSYSFSITNAIYHALRNYDDKLIITCKIDQTRKYYEIIQLELSFMTKSWSGDDTVEPFASIFVDASYADYWGDRYATIKVRAESIPLEFFNIDIEDHIKQCLKRQKHLDPVFTTTNSVKLKERFHSGISDYDDGIPPDNPLVSFPKKTICRMEFQIHEKYIGEYEVQHNQTYSFEDYTKVGQSVVPYVVALRDEIERLRLADKSVEKPAPSAGSI